MSRSMNVPALPELVSVDTDERDLCKDERCPIIEPHTKHLVVGGRGRRHRNCPNCGSKLQRTKIGETTVLACKCGWHRF